LAAVGFVDVSATLTSGFDFLRGASYWRSVVTMDNIQTWTGLRVEESVRMTEDRDKWRKYVHGVANPRIEDG